MFGYSIMVGWCAGGLAGIASLIQCVCACCCSGDDEEGNGDTYEMRTGHGHFSAVPTKPDAYQEYV